MRSRRVHVEVLRHTLPASVAVAAQHVSLGGDAPVCIGERLRENGDGLVAKVLETHAHVRNVSPRIADGAKLPVENCKRAAGVQGAVKRGNVDPREERACLYVAEEPVPEQPQTTLWMPKSPWTMRTLLPQLSAAASPQGARRSWSWCICEMEASVAQGAVASNCCDHRLIWRERKALGDPKSARPDKLSQLDTGEGARAHPLERKARSG